MGKRKPYPHCKIKNKFCIFPAICKCPTCKVIRTEMWEKPTKGVQYKYCDTHKLNRHESEEGEGYTDCESANKPVTTRKARAAI